MKVLRILVWLVAAFTFAAPPAAAHAPPQAHHADRDCSGHGDAQKMAHACCPSMACSHAVVSALAGEPMSPTVERPPLTSSSLEGLTPARDPPPPRA